MNYTIRFMLYKDMTAVLELAMPVPELLTDFVLIQMLRQRAFWGLVAERDDVVVGFVLFEVRDTDFRLHRLDVKPDSPGADRALWLHMENKLEPHGKAHITVPGGFRVPCRSERAKTESP